MSIQKQEWLYVKGECINMLEIMLLAWVLTWFKLDQLFVEGINQIFNTNFTTAIYWLLFLIIGVIHVLIELKRR